jgi:membrane protein insertase Oxa1/YidC/SpoIIIJ
MQFLGFIDMAGKSAVLAIIAGITQYIQINLSLPKQNQNEKQKKELSIKEEFFKNMQFQMRYLFPIMIVFISYTISGAVALYWAVSNIFSIAQEVYSRKKQPK